MAKKTSDQVSQVLKQAMVSWFKLKKAQNRSDFERAKLLTPVFKALPEASAFYAFVHGTLHEEMKAAVEWRSLVSALAWCSDQMLWVTLGTKAIVFLASIDNEAERDLYAKDLQRRAVKHEVLGDTILNTVKAKYEASKKKVLLPAPSTRPHPAHDLDKLRAFAIKALELYPKLEGMLDKELKRIVGRGEESSAA